MATIEALAPSGAPFVDGADRDEYMGRPMLIHGVTHEPNARFGPRWVVEVALLDSGEAIALGLTSNPHRDRLMGTVRAALDEGTDIDPVILFRDEAHRGSWSFRSATYAEIEALGRLAAGEDDNAEEPATDAPKGKGK